MGLVIKGNKPKTLPTPQEAPNQFEQHVQSLPITATVHATKDTGPKGAKVSKVIKDTSETVHPGVMSDPAQLIRLGIDASHTVNLGNFNSAKIGVSINLPCTKATLEETYAYGLQWVSDKIEEAISDAKN